MTTRIGTFCCATAIGLLLSLPARADDWGTLGLDGPRSRLSGERSGPLFGPERWERSLPDVPDPVYRALLASPAVADGYLVHATLNNAIRALRETDGALLWEVKTRDAVFSSPAIWRGWVYAADTARQLYAVRLADGGLVWTRQLDGAVHGSPVVVAGSLFVVTNAPGPRVVKLDPLTGAVVWRAGEELIEQDLNAGVTVAEGRVIVGETTGRYHSFDLATGEHQWTALTAGVVHMSSPVVINGRVYLLPGGELNQLHALEIDSGKPVRGWPVSLPSPPPVGGSLRREYVFSSVAGAGDRLVFDRRVEDRLDRSGDGVVDALVLEEAVLAVDAAEGRVLWSRPNGRRETHDLNGGPTHGLCPTPALYAGAASGTLVAVASSLSARLRVLDLAGGDERWSADLSGATRGSPVLANGRLVVGTDAGVIHSFLSRTNAPPARPVAVSPVAGADADAAAVTLRWMGGLDSEDGPVQYEVRLDDDGEVLHDWELATGVARGQHALDLTAQLVPGRVYTFAVRGRDGHGAWSPWSQVGQFRAVLAPSVQLDGVPVASLTAALGLARAGSVIQLGAGTYPLSSPLRLPAGVALVGAAPHLTTLSGKGLAVAVQAGQGNALRQLTVTGAAIGVVAAGADDVRLQNVVLRDNSDAGLQVQGGAGADLISATVARNGTGVRAAGALRLRNSILTANTVGLEATGASAVSSRYNDVFGNRTSDYVGAQRAATDRSDPIVFGSGDEDLRITRTQATTDQGDPADEFVDEPLPNGGRINLGAFGNTPFAELSEPLPPPPAPPEAPPAEKKSQSSGGLCSLGSGGGLPDGSVLLIALVLFVRRRGRRTE